MFSCLRPHWKWSPRTEPESVWLHDIRWLEHCTDPRHFLHIVTYSRISEYLKLPGSILSSLHLTDLYGVSQEECARFRESVPYVILHRYNPKHLYPKLNGLRDNGIENCGLPCGPRTIAVSWDAYLLVGLLVEQPGRLVTSPLNILVWCIVLRNVSISMTWMQGTLQLQLMALCHSQVTLMKSTDINITETTYSCHFQYEFGTQ